MRRAEIVAKPKRISRWLVGLLSVPPLFVIVGHVSLWGSYLKAQAGVLDGLKFWLLGDIVFWLLLPAIIGVIAWFVSTRRMVGRRDPWKYLQALWIAGVVALVLSVGFGAA